MSIDYTIYRVQAVCHSVIKHQITWAHQLVMYSMFDNLNCFTYKIKWQIIIVLFVFCFCFSMWERKEGLLQSYCSENNVKRVWFFFFLFLIHLHISFSVLFILSLCVWVGTHVRRTLVVYESIAIHFVYLAMLYYYNNYCCCCCFCCCYSFGQSILLCKQCSSKQDNIECDY